MAWTINLIWCGSTSYVETCGSTHTTPWWDWDHSLLKRIHKINSMRRDWRNTTTYSTDTYDTQVFTTSSTVQVITKLVPSPLGISPAKLRTSCQAFCLSDLRFWQPWVPLNFYFVTSVSYVNWLSSQKPFLEASLEQVKPFFVKQSLQHVCEEPLYLAPGMLESLVCS